MSKVDARRRVVKSRRKYDARSRRDRAEASRRRIVQVAERAFLERGYARATIAEVAAEAEVSVDTVYKSFGGKAGLVRAVYDAALRGSETIPAEERSDRLQATEGDPHAIVRGWGAFVAELAPKATPIFRLVRTASLTDPEVAALADAIDADRLERMAQNARRLAAAGHLRRGVDVERARDVLWTYSSPELYELLVMRRGMPVAEYGRFVGDAMAAALL